MIQKTITDSRKADQEPKILLLGDLIIDSYVYVNTTKISPEAPVPVVTLVGEEVISPGGAGLAAAFAGANNIPIVLGTYTNAHRAKWLHDEYSICDITGILGDVGKTNAIKTRYIDIDSGYHMLRVDSDDLVNSPFKDNNNYEVWRDKISNILENNNICLILVLDYNKGLINDFTYKNILELSRLNDIPCYIDSRKLDIRFAKTSNIIKLNKKEYDRAILACGAGSIDELATILNVEHLIVTTGSTGAHIYSSGAKQTIYRQPDKAIGQLDVTGCGDVFDISFCYAKYIKDMDIEDALYYAVNQACIYAHAPIDRRLKCQSLL